MTEDQKIVKSILADLPSESRADWEKHLNNVIERRATTDELIAKLQKVTEEVEAEMDAWRERVIDQAVKAFRAGEKHAYKEALDYYDYIKAKHDPTYFDELALEEAKKLRQELLARHEGGDNGRG